VLQDDGAHLTTPIQGLVANDVVAALNSRGYSLTPLSNDEILSISGVATQPPSSTVTLNWQTLTSKCKRSTSVCRIKGKLLARNGTSAQSPMLSLSFWLSTDSTVDAADLALGTGAIPALPPGKSRKLKLRTALPAGVDPAGRYLITVPASGPVFVRGPM
jgi:hypothetical protein